MPNLGGGAETGACFSYPQLLCRLYDRGDAHKWRSMGDVFPEDVVGVYSGMKVPGLQMLVERGLANMTRVTIHVATLFDAIDGGDAFDRDFDDSAKPFIHRSSRILGKNVTQRRETVGTEAINIRSKRVPVVLDLRIIQASDQGPDDQSRSEIPDFDRLLGSEARLR